MLNYESLIIVAKFSRSHSPPHLLRVPSTNLHQLIIHHDTLGFPPMVTQKQANWCPDNEWRTCHVRNGVHIVMLARGRPRCWIICSCCYLDRRQREHHLDNIGVKRCDYATGRTVSNAITYAIAVLAVSGPCALGLAVSMVLVVAGRVAARGGVIIRSGDLSERAHQVNDVLFDKTGTLNTGELDVVVGEYLSHDPTEAASLADSLVRDNNDPISMAVARYLLAKELPINRFEDI